ncbi:MAG: DNA polymerase I [Gemmataceae bacterium]
MAPAGAPEIVVLVDAHALIYQVFHAIPEMTGPDGRPVNALYGFTRDLFFLREQIKPTYLLCAFDRAEPTFRSDIAPDYKATRKEPPDDLISQVPRIQAVIEAFNMPVLTKERFEADDILATVAVAAEKRGCDVLLATSDKDCRQLISDRVKIFNLRKQLKYDRESLKTDWGIAPEQVVDFQSLVGDSVDNVKGVPGIGPKTAAKLLQQFGTLDNLLTKVDELPKGKMKQNLIAHREAALTARKLVKLDTNVDIPLDWQAWQVRDYDGPRLLALFEEAGFRTFANKVRNQPAAPARSDGEPALAPRTGGSLFPEDESVGDFAFGANAPATPPADAWSYDGYELVDTKAKFDKFLKALKKQKRFAVDLETTDLDPLRADVVGLAFSWKEGEGHYLAIRGPEGAKLLDEATTLGALKPILEDPKVAKVNQNIKYDALCLGRHGIPLAGIAGDSMVADYLLRAGERSHGLDELARRQLGHENIHIEELIGKKGKKQIRMDQVPTEKVARYAAEDADVAWRLTNMLEAELDREGLRKLYDEVEVPLIATLIEIESYGIRLDVPFLERLSAQMETQLAVVEKEIHGLAGYEFNIASLKQLRVVLFDELKLPIVKRTGLTGEPSTDQESLEKLAELGHALPQKIIEHRQISKLKGTYVDALPALVNPYTGRLHTSFNQTVAATGRLSSSDPNLQNIPTRTDMGREIRQAFLPAEGWQLVAADYSQIELRLLAHFCGDENLRRAFAEDRDIHASVAAEIFKVPEAKVTTEQRRMAKTVNFGVIYGMSAFGLATRLGILQKEATTFIDDYFARFPAVQAYQEELLRKAAKTKFVSTLLGRRRHIEGIRPNASVKGLNQPEREAVNMEVQGSAADLMKLAMLAVRRELAASGLKSRMLLTVHDELVFEAPPEEVIPLAALARRTMSEAMSLTVPLAVDVAAGPNWLEVEEIA